MRLASILLSVGAIASSSSLSCVADEIEDSDSESSDGKEDGQSTTKLAKSCERLASASNLAKRTRDFMLSEKLILPGEESNPDSTEGLRSRWVPAGTAMTDPMKVPGIASQPVCAVLMRLQLSLDAASEYTAQGGVELLGYDGKKLRRFESTPSVTIPATLRAGLAFVDSTGESESGEWYAEFSGSSAIDLAKDFVILNTFPNRIRTDGLTAEVDVNRSDTAEATIITPTGKLEWDPTPNRSWKLTKHTWSLRRGQTGEAFDVLAAGYDEALNSVSAVNPLVILKSDGNWLGTAMPWGSGELHKLFLNGEWRVIQ